MNSSRRRRQAGNNVLSRRRLIGALGGAAVYAGLPGCEPDASEPPPPPTGSVIKVVDGYTGKQSYRQGELVTLYLNAETKLYGVININDYAGKTVLSVPAHASPQQPQGPSPWETGFGYQPTVSFLLPDLPSGVYLVDNLVPLIVKSGVSVPLGGGAEIPSPTDILIVYPTNTVAAYNPAGGLSMYSTPTPAPIVSFHRPVGWTSNVALFSATLEWFVQVPLPYNVGFIADIDLENYSEIANTKLLLVIGHSEYWTRRARENFDTFVLGGGNALMLSGNNMWWQVRYSDDQTQMICYKRVPDPIDDPLMQTINWSQSRLQYPITRSLGADFPRGGFGSARADSFCILAPKSPVFKNIFVRKGDLLGVPTLEYDGAPLLNDPVTSGEPRLDLAALDAYRVELIGYSHCSANEAEVSTTSHVLDRVGTWIVYQRKETSGIMINGASTNWCSRTGAFGKDGFRVRRVITNMIDVLVNGLSPFSS